MKRITNDLRISGAAIDTGPIELKVGELSNELKQLIKSSDIAVSLDDLQFQFCKEMSRMKDDDPLKDDCRRIGLMIIAGINQLKNYTQHHKRATRLHSEKRARQ